MKRRLFLLICLFFAGLGAIRATPVDDNAAPVSGWIYFDAPLWDIANEGLPFRFTLALPSRRDLLTRALFAAEARWTLGIGYAKVYNSYDATTGIFMNPGGHAAMFSAGRQFRWELPRVAAAFTPDVVIEFGFHYATRRFPADGTHANLKLISGLEWKWTRGGAPGNWIVGLMWPHFSNADLLKRNSGYDGLALRIGRQLRF